MLNLNFNFEGIKKLSEWWPIIKSNLQAIQNVFNSHVLGIDDKHQSEHINYDGIAGGSNVKTALNNLKTDITNITILPGTEHDPLVTSSLVDEEGEDFGPSGAATYLDGRMRKWEQKQLSHMAENVSLVQKYGAVADKVTDNTEIAKQAIHEIFIQGGGRLIIPYGCLWRYDLIDNAYSGTATEGTGTTLTDTTKNWEINELIGALIWNTTDKSYGIIIANTTTTITVTAMYLGTANVFNTGDSYRISLHKVGVIIDDQSSFDYYNDSFTAQRKFIVNCDIPHNKAANEFHFSAPYHPAFVVDNTGPGGMEARASFIARHFLNGVLSKAFQIALDQNTGNFSPSEMQFLINIYNGTNETEVLGIRCPDALTREYGFGTRAQAGYSEYHRYWGSGDNKHAFNSPTRKITEYMLNSVVKFKEIIDTVNGEIIYQDGSAVNILRLTNKGELSAVRSKVEHYTVDHVFVNTDSNKTITNNGAATTVNLYLPNTLVSVGCEFEFVVLSAYNLVIKPTTGVNNQIRGTTAVDKGVYSNVVGDSIKLKCVKDGYWEVVSSKGTWTYI